MKKYNKSIGSYGESVATKHLISMNYEVLHKNFTCKLGEIDIIAKKEDIICFIEVKSRFSTQFGSPKESINIRKVNKIIKVAKYYLTINKISNYFIRFDCIEVFFSNKNSDYSVSHIKDAFRPIN